VDASILKTGDMMTFPFRPDMKGATDYHCTVSSIEGNLHQVFPAWASGFVTSPKQVIHYLRSDGIYFTNDPKDLHGSLERKW
jgi:hypothetical protein